jgi:ABC-2 type transport system permease protein
VNRLIRAELLKLRTTRTVYGLAGATAANVVLAVVATVLGAGRGDSTSLERAEGVRAVLSGASQGTVYVLVLGILIMAGEFRHNTVTSTFLVTPDRGRVVGAKLVTSAMAGAGFAVLASVLTLAIALPWLAVKDVPRSLIADEVGLVLVGAFVATAVYGVVGVGVGALVRNQLAAVAIALGWMLVVEQLLVTLVPEVGRWLPLGAASALVRATQLAGGMLPMWGGALLFAAYGVAFAYAGTRLVVRRDVT